MYEIIKELKYNERYFIQRQMIDSEHQRTVFFQPSRERIDAVTINERNASFYNCIRGEPEKTKGPDTAN